MLHSAFLYRLAEGYLPVFKFCQQDLKAAAHQLFISYIYLVFVEQHSFHSIIILIIPYDKEVNIVLQEVFVVVYQSLHCSRGLDLSYSVAPATRYTYLPGYCYFILPLQELTQQA